MAIEEAPPFWWKPAGPLAWLFSPLSFLWGRGSAMRMRRRPTGSVGAPVLCIGNFIAGGAGKTPTAIEFARAARARGLNPGFLSRGHGGRLVGQVVVDPHHHRAADVGDEPLLLARETMTVVSADRPRGAQLLVANGCDFVIMDDGFQNPSLAKDYSLVVVDAKRGIGNGWVIPSGPLRAPLGRQLMRASAVLVIGEAPGGDKVIRETARHGKPVFLARIEPVDREAWAGRRCLAYAGIADPTKFFDSLGEVGAETVELRPFADHHVYSEEEAGDLLEKARAGDLVLATTAKDMARLAGEEGAMAELAAASKVLEIGLAFDDPRAATLIIDATLRNAKARLVREHSGHYD